MFACYVGDSLWPACEASYSKFRKPPYQAAGGEEVGKARQLWGAKQDGGLRSKVQARDVGRMLLTWELLAEGFLLWESLAILDFFRGSLLPRR
jgi:hypothetical protein